MKRGLILFFILIITMVYNLNACDDTGDAVHVSICYPGGPTVTVSLGNLSEAKCYLGWSIPDSAKNANWLIEIEPDIYHGAGWTNYTWDLNNNGPIPNSPYRLKFKSVNTGNQAVFDGDYGTPAAAYGLIFQNVERVDVEYITFRDFSAICLQFLNSPNCTINHCNFPVMPDTSSARGAITLENGSDYCTVYDNHFGDLDGGSTRKLHAVYIVDSDDNDITYNEIDYCSGAVFKCRNGADDNTFDHNEIGGCGNYAYFTARPMTAIETLSSGNIVSNTLVTGHGHSYVYTNDVDDNSVFIRKFVYGYEPWNFPEYEWPSRHLEIYVDTAPFCIPDGHTGNNFRTILDDFDVDVDPVIGENPAYIYLNPNPIGDANNPLHRGKYEFNANGSGAYVSLVDEETIYDLTSPYDGNDTYLNKIEISEDSKKPRTFFVNFKLRTCEGDIIYKGYLEGTDGVLELEKRIVTTFDTGGDHWILNIEGAGVDIDFSNSNNYNMYLYTMAGTSVRSGTSFQEELSSGVNYKLKITGAATVTIKPVDGVGKNSKPKISSIDLPQKFTLFNNYPNPFNPTTTIHYSMAVQSIVKLNVYDLHGRQVKTLINEVKEPGEYSVVWNGKNDNGLNMPSGTYICKMISENYQNSIKLILLK